MRKTLGVIALIVLAIWIVGESVDSYTCRFDGHERSIVFSEGRREGRVASENYGPRFPSLQRREKFGNAGFTVLNLEQYRFCDDRYVNPITVVHFGVPDGFAFAPSSIPPSELREPEPRDPSAPRVDGSSFERRMAINEFVPWNAQWNLQGGRQWIPSQRLGVGLKAQIAKFDIDWLRNETLDETDLIGLWHQGWLFRSQSPAQYIWVE